MKWPLLPVVLAYSAGLLIAEWAHPALPWLFGASLTVGMAALVCGRARQWLIWPLLVLTGWTNLSWRSAVLAPDDIRLLVSGAGEAATIRGKLVATPSQRVFLRDERQVPRFLAELDLAELRRENSAWRSASGRVLVATPGLLPASFFGGQQVEVDGFLAAPPQALAEGLFDYRDYLRRQGIYFQLRAHSTNEWTLVGPAAPRPVADRFLSWAQQILGRGLGAEDTPLELLWAMTLGWRAGITNEIYEPFMQTGTMHIFAISGLHIVLIAGLLVKLLGVVHFPRRLSAGVIFPLIWFYTAATGWQPSAVRSTIMMSIVIGGWALNRPSNLLNSLASAAFIILLWDPNQLFGVSFQLSFLVVLSLALLLPPIDSWAQRQLRPDPLLPESLVPRWQATLHRPLRWLVASMATSVAAWLGSLPLCASYFHLFSPATLLANLVVVPMSSAALGCNVGAIIVGGALPQLAIPFNYAAWGLMKGIVELSQWAAIPGRAFWYISSFRWYDYVFYYMVIGVALTTLWLRARTRWLMCLLLVCGCFYSFEYYFCRSNVAVTALPLQNGAAVFVDGPGRNDWLIDTGDKDAVQFLTRPFLRAQGVNRLEHIILTHGDARHVAGAPLIEQSFSVPHIIAGSTRFRSPVYKRVISSLNEESKPPSFLEAGQTFGPWKVLHPPGGARFARADDAALVLLGQFNGTRVLILPDLGKLGQTRLLEQAMDLQAEVLILAGPAVDVLENKKFLERVGPRAVVCCDPELRGTALAPAPEIQRRSPLNIPVFRTADLGAVKLLITPRAFRISPTHGNDVVWTR